MLKNLSRKALLLSLAVLAVGGATTAYAIGGSYSIVTYYTDATFQVEAGMGGRSCYGTLPQSGTKTPYYEVETGSCNGTLDPVFVCYDSGGQVLCPTMR